MESKYPQLLRPTKLWSRAEVLRRPSPVPRSSGVYAWYFSEIPAGTPAGECLSLDGLTLLYIGIAPKKALTSGAKPSQQTLWSRIRYHMRGNAFGSTLRESLGCLLADDLGIALRRVRSKSSTKREDNVYRYTFTKLGEATLDEWLGRTAFVTWQTEGEPWNLEAELIRTLSLPLNLDQNRHHAFHSGLSAKRRAAREIADHLPVVWE